MVLFDGKTYKLVNAQTTERCLDLSGVDNTTIIGYEYHQGANQHWVLKKKGQGWTLRAVEPAKFLGLDHATPGNGIRLVGTDKEFVWQILDDEQSKDPKVLRLFVPGTKLNADLSDHGNIAPGAIVHLWEKSNGKNQAWIFEALA